MNIRACVIFFLSTFLAIFSCTIPKDARQLKRSTKEWRKSSPVLDAYADSPFSGSFLTLRENKKFERTSSGLLMSFEAGTWTMHEDTIRLIYLNNERDVARKQSVFIDRETSTLIFEGEEAPLQMRMRVILNKL